MGKLKFKNNWHISSVKDEILLSKDIFNYVSSELN